MEFIYETIDVISEGIRAFIGGFARIFLISLLIWMILLVILLFRELFTPGDLDFKEYFKKVWKMLKLAFEGVAYAAVFVAPILIYRSEEDKLTNSMVWVASILLSITFLFLRRRSKSQKKKEDAVQYHHRMK